MSTQAFVQVQQWKEQIRQEGRKEGRTEGRKEGRTEGRKEARQALAGSLRSGLLDTYRARFGTVPVAIQKAVQLVRDPDELARWFPLFSSKSAEEIAGILDAASSGSL